MLTQQQQRKHNLTITSINAKKTYNKVMVMSLGQGRACKTKEPHQYQYQSYGELHVALLVHGKFW